MENEERETKEYGKIQWFFMGCFIPLVFTVILAVVVLSFMGISVIEKTKEFGSNIPVVSSWIDDDVEEIIDVDELHMTIEDKHNEIESLQGQVEERELEVNALTKEVSQLLARVDELEQEVIDVEIEYGLEQVEIAKTYEAMKPKDAARIIAELELNKAIEHISTLKAETRAAILAQMNPERAAEILTSLFNE